MLYLIGIYKFQKTNPEVLWRKLKVFIYPKKDFDRVMTTKSSSSSSSSFQDNSMFSSSAVQNQF